MNDPGLDGNIQNTSTSSQPRHRNSRHDWHSLHQSVSLPALSDGSLTNGIQERRRYNTALPIRHTFWRTERSSQPIERHTSRRLQEDRGKSDGEDAEEEYYQSTLWWFTSVAFPLIAGTFGPIANLLSICGLVQTWRVSKPSGSRIGDPGWVLALNIVSLVLALLANVLLLFNFARRIPYSIAQPFTIIFWYLSCILLLVPISVTHTTLLHQSSSYALSQSYYYAFIACILYFIISTLLLLNVLGASHPFKAYAPSFAQLSTPQRTIMLQTILFSAYLALGGGVFAAIEDWDFVDGVYWADYTLLTIGLGSDFPVTTVAGRMLVIPYTALGIVFVGLIVSNVRALVLERGKARIAKRRLAKERERWEAIIDQGDEKGEREAQGRADAWGKSRSEREVKRFIKTREKFEAKELRLQGKIHAANSDDSEIWRKREFELMRYIERSANRTEGYIALGFSVFAFVIVWVGGSLVFWACELNDAQWTYPTALYFAYTSITTIGYGDFYPTTAFARPFFVIWSLVAVPTVTVLIATMGETVLDGVKEGVEWLGSKSLLPEKSPGGDKVEHKEMAVDVEKGQSRKFRGWIKGGRARTKSTISSQQLIHDSSSTSTTEEAATRTETPLAQNQAKGTQARGEVIREQGTQIIEETAQEHLTLTIRLTREISRLATDASQVPPIRYTWSEWLQWLKLMDEAEGILGVVVDTPGAGRRPPLARLGKLAGGNGRRTELLVPALGDATNATEEENGGGEMGEVASTVKVWKWTWLDDRGPLFSADTETQWVLNKLCMLLEKVAQKELEIAVRR